MPRRHRARHVFRRRRSSHRRSRRSRFGSSKGIFSILGKVAPPIAFLDQLNDNNRGDYANKDWAGKGKTLLNSVTGKVFNFNVFKDVPQYSQNINPAGIANKYTAIGLASIVAGAVLPKMGLRIPMMGKAISLGKKLLPAGILGGLFDDPVGFSHATFANQVTSASSNVNPSLLVGNSGNRQ